MAWVRHYFVADVSCRMLAVYKQRSASKAINVYSLDEACIQMEGKVKLDETNVLYTFKLTIAKPFPVTLVLGTGREATMKAWVDGLRGATRGKAAELRSLAPPVVKGRERGRGLGMMDHNPRRLKAVRPLQRPSKEPSKPLNPLEVKKLYVKNLSAFHNLDGSTVSSVLLKSGLTIIPSYMSSDGTKWRVVPVEVAASLVVQRWWRMRATRRMYLKSLRKYKATIVIQAIWRGYLCRRFYHQIRRAVLTIQSNWRDRFNHRLQLHTFALITQFRRDSVTIQRVWKGYRVRKYVWGPNGLRDQIYAVRKIIRFYRSHIIQLCLSKLNHHATTIQRNYRSYKNRKYTKLEIIMRQKRRVCVLYFFQTLFQTLFQTFALQHSSHTLTHLYIICTH
jgi:hypothetical protein